MIRKAVSFIFKLFDDAKAFEKLSGKERIEFIRLVRGKSKLTNYNNNFEVRNELVAYGVKYSLAFMNNLFLYLENNRINLDNKGLFCFIRMSGVYTTSDNGDVTIRKYDGPLTFIFSMIVIVALIYMLGETYVYLIETIRYYSNGKILYAALNMTMVIIYAMAGIFMAKMFHEITYSHIGSRRIYKKYKKYWLSNISSEPENRV